MRRYRDLSEGSKLENEDQEQHLEIINLAPPQYH
jgi:hypothetical protein